MTDRRDPDLRALAAADPIDGDAVMAAWDRSAVAAQQLEEIIAMPTLTRPIPTQPTTAAPRRLSEVTRPRHRRTWVRTGGLVGATAALGAALAILPGTATTGSRAFAVRPLEGGVVVIDVFSDFRDGDALAADLRQYGIDVRIATQPVSPSLVGTVVSQSTGSGDAGTHPGVSYDVGDSAPGVFTLSIDPAVFRGPLRLDVGVAAAPGEAYVTRNEVFDDGEVLGGLPCLIGETFSPDELAPYVERLGLTTLWDVVTDVAPDPTGATWTSVAMATPPVGQVTSAYATDDRTVQVTVLPSTLSEHAALFAGWISTDGCTAEAAARWQ